VDSWQAGEAAAVLRHVVTWELSQPRWDRVNGLLDAIEAALDADDAEVLAAAATELVRSGPVRIVRIGSREPTTAPPRISERANQLVHRLTAAAVHDDPATDSGPETSGGRQAE
jgi:hypothetical protein